MSEHPDKHGGYSLAQAVREAYSQGQTDYNLEPLVRVGMDGQPIGQIQDGDTVIFCCRRGEREIELTEAFTSVEFSHFNRPQLQNLNFIILTLYHEKFVNLPVAFAPSKVNSTLGEAISKAGLTQLRCSESEKFAHITFFLNGGTNEPFPGESRVRIPSPKGVPFDQMPELSLPAVADEVIKGLETGYDCIITNFANGDVIGHTASAEAKIRCAEVVDEHLGRVIEAASEQGYVVLITADHGNLEEMLTPDGKPNVAHTTNLVPFLFIDPLTSQTIQPADGSLQDIAPTLLNILGVPVPVEITGSTLLPKQYFNDKRRVLLIILDGWGIGKADPTNPIHLANTPVWDKLVVNYHPSQLQASGEHVGLQPGKAGNSEAGHMNIGAGRVILQDDVRLDQAIKDGTFAKNEVFQKAMESTLEQNKRLHLLGLLTEKSSHGSIDYPLALLRLAKEKGLEDVYLHLILDGRSTEPGSAPALLEKLEGWMAEIGVGQVVSAVGRGIALDRDGNYAKIQRAYDSLVLGLGNHYSTQDGM